MEKFYLSKNGKPVGPWNRAEIAQELRAGRLSMTDYYYDEEKKDWALLLEREEFSSSFDDKTLMVLGSAEHHLQSPEELPPSSQPERSPVLNLKNKEWYALKGDNRYGPFNQLELIRMLQGKELFEYDYVWSAPFSNWRRIADCKEFSPERVKSLNDSGLPEVKDAFFRRRHARVRYGTSLVVHDNKNVWKGESLEISPGGCGLQVDNDRLQPGQSVFLHFKVGDGVPPFNAICEIVSKMPRAEGSTGHRYGVKFTNITRQVQLAIQEFTQKAA